MAGHRFQCIPAAPAHSSVNYVVPSAESTEQMCSALLWTAPNPYNHGTNRTKCVQCAHGTQNKVFK